MLPLNLFQILYYCIFTNIFNIFCMNQDCSKSRTLWISVRVSLVSGAGEGFGDCESDLRLRTYDISDIRRKIDIKFGT